MRILGLLAGLIAIIVGGVIAYASFIMLEPSRIKPLIESEIAKATGRSVTIAGELSPSISFSPTISASNITLGNTDWGKAEHMLQAEELAVSFQLIPLLSGNFTIDAITLSGAQLYLEKKGKQNNWTLTDAKPEELETVEEAPVETSPKAEFTISELRIENSIIYYADRSAGKQYQFDVAQLDASEVSETQVESLSLNATYNGANIEANAELEAPLLMFDITASKPQASLEAKGSLSLSDNVFDADVALNADSLAKLLALAKIQSQDQSPLSLSANIGGSAKLITFSALTTTYGDITASGQGKLDLSKSNPKLEGALKIASLDARGGKKTAPASAPVSDTQAEPTQKFMIPREKLPFNSISEFDADIALSVDEILFDGATLKNVESHVRLNNERLLVTDFSADKADGNITGKISLNARSEVPTYDLVLQTNRMTLGALLTELSGDQSISGGLITAKLNAKGSGQSLHDMASTANGAYDMLIEEATYTPPETAQSASAFFNLLRGGEGKNEPITIKCGIAHFDITDGIANAEQIAVQSPAALVFGKGRINLRKETLRVSLKARSTLLSFADVVPPLVVAGSWANPVVTLDAQSSLVNIGKIALGVATGGVGLAVLGAEQVTDKLGITAENNPCVKAIAEAAEKAAKADADPEATFKATEDNIREIRDEVKDNVKGDIKDVEKDVKAIRDGLKDMFKKD